MEKRLPQLYFIKMKISYDLGFIASESPWQRYDAITFFIYCCVSLYQEFFDANSIFLLNVHVYMKLVNNATE